ncbi:fatty acid desaturase [Ralstonia pseudosolanacearum]|uniref:fatty acid desaturase family protein n=1 Tax=Ralstonia pseudosolanacearum TaxID=1310165 RepID=UPI0018666BFE|nr:fatty acid desaturase [Ralstonia pseudosolanacearum]QOK91384.1 fatty acid desaturase [Ralstonia pseudosolanacearum]
MAYKTIGYHSSMPKEKLASFRREFSARNHWLALLYVICVPVSMLVAGYMAWSFSADGSLGAARWVMEAVVCIFFARQLRAMENIVHFGSHLNITSKRSVNDAIVNAVAAVPTFQWVQRYRVFHNKHHVQFGGDDDPCKNRIEAINGIRDRVESRQLGLVSGIVYGIYSFYREVGSNRTILLYSLLYHAAAYFAMNALNPAFAGFFYGHLLVAGLLVLPCLRLVAEWSEHDYAASDAEAQATFNNCSVVDKLIFHPAGDAYHLLHHLYPAIPWWRQGAAHRYLMAEDYNYRTLMHRADFFQRLAIPQHDMSEAK